MTGTSLPALIVTLFSICLLAQAKQLAPAHRYWFDKDAPAPGDYTDRKWNYCDDKCLYLENYNPGKDFVVIKFAQLFKEKFSACYVKSNTQYILWNKIIQNSFFEKMCGGDYKDWYNEGFKVEGYYGVGLGVDAAIKTV